ncbi:MAG: hypothetical protein AAGF02_08605 [Actinomycetota bacterium]
MARVVTILDLDDDVLAALRRRAADEDTTVAAVLASMAKRSVNEPRIDEWVQRNARRGSTLSVAAVHEAFSHRTDWPA